MKYECSTGNDRVVPIIMNCILSRGEKGLSGEVVQLKSINIEMFVL